MPDDALPPSPYPKANVARVLDPHASKLGGTLVARQLGHLIIKVTFHKIPCPGLEVKFYEANDDGSKGEAIGDPQKTDRAGIAAIDTLVNQGLYVCEVENQVTLTMVPTVSDRAKPYQVPTPIDRPYFDFDEQDEFDDEERWRDEYESFGDGEGSGTEDEPEGVMSISFCLKSADALDDAYPKFLLEATDGSYRRELPAKQALKEKDGWRELVFRGLIEGASYRLTKFHNEEYSEVVFDEEPYEAIVRQKHEAGQLLEKHAYSGFEGGPASKVEWS